MSASETIIEIQRGTYEGECLLDCDEWVELRPDGAVYALTSRIPDDDHPDIRAEAAIDADDWAALVDAVDVEHFAALPARIGEPDAADAGGEWVRIATPGGAHRVDFERGAAPPGLAPLLERLRALRARLAERHGRRQEPR